MVVATHNHCPRPRPGPSQLSFQCFTIRKLGRPGMLYVLWHCNYLLYVCGYTLIQLSRLHFILKSCLVVITPRACARGKVIGSVVVVVVVVVVSTKIAKSQKVGAWQSALCHQTVESHEKLSFVCFKSLRTPHEHCKSCIFTGHAYWSHLPKPCAVSIAHARSQNR